MPLVPCPDCDGPKISLFENVGCGKCSACHGLGKGLMDELVETFGGESECYVCHGTGQCQTCGGNGEISGHAETDDNTGQTWTTRHESGTEQDAEESASSEDSRLEDERRDHGDLSSESDSAEPDSTSTYTGGAEDGRDESPRNYSSGSGYYSGGYSNERGSRKSRRNRRSSRGYSGGGGYSYSPSSGSSSTDGYPESWTHCLKAVKVKLTNLTAALCPNPDTASIRT